MMRELGTEGGLSMTSSSTQWLQQFTGNAQATQAVRPVAGRSNPFQNGSGANQHSQGDDGDVGVNRPYETPRFLGYFRNQAVYAGGRLNVSC
jgi:hypothetical protein